MTPERESRIREECGVEESCPCHDEKSELAEEIDRLRSLLATADHTIYALTEFIVSLRYDPPKASMDWFAKTRDEKFRDYER